MGMSPLWGERRVTSSEHITSSGCVSSLVRDTPCDGRLISGGDVS